MSVIRRAQQVPIGGVIENVLSGSPFEFTGRPSTVGIAISQTTSQGQVVCDITFGSEVIGQDIHVSDEVGAGQGPRIPDYVVARDVAAAGDRLVVKLRETGGVTATDTVVLVTIDAL